MRSARFVLPLLLLAAGAAPAATPEEDYIAARDAAIASVSKAQAKNPAADTSKMEQKALAGLEKRLQAIIGPLSVAPYPAKGRSALATLAEEGMGAGVLDSLRFSAPDDGPQVHVTTDGLLVRWLSKPEEWWKKSGDTPPTVEAALANPDFYTRAIGIDAALTKTADLPITTPNGTSYAVALLGGWAQDVGPNPEQEIIVALRKDGKLYLAQETARSYKPIATCEAVWRDGQRKADAAMKKYSDGGAKDEKAFDRYSALQEKADKDYHACYAEKTPAAPFFPALVKEAQAIADRFGAK